MTVVAYLGIIAHAGTGGGQVDVSVKISKFTENIENDCNRKKPGLEDGPRLFAS
jgi:hypothetical protein